MQWLCPKTRHFSHPETVISERREAHRIVLQLYYWSSFRKHSPRKNEDKHPLLFLSYSFCMTEYLTSVGVCQVFQDLGLPNKASKHSVRPFLRYYPQTCLFIVLIIVSWDTQVLWYYILEKKKGISMDLCTYIVLNDTKPLFFISRMHKMLFKWDLGSFASWPRCSLRVAF